MGVTMRDGAGMERVALRLLRIRTRLLKAALAAAAEGDLEQDAMRRILAEDSEAEGAVEALTEALVAPATEAPARKVRRAAKKNGASSPAPQADGEPKETGPSQERILAVLERGAMTSGEIIKRTGLKAAAVYTALGVMRGRGLIEGFTDPEDGQRKNRRVNHHAA
jgi:DNA-binding MarR family transcriptional regulator